MKDDSKKVNQIEFDKWLISINEERDIYKIIFIYKKLEKVKKYFPHIKEYIRFLCNDNGVFRELLNKMHKSSFNLSKFKQQLPLISEEAFNNIEQHIEPYQEIEKAICYKILSTLLFEYYYKEKDFFIIKHKKIFFVNSAIFPGYEKVINKCLNFAEVFAAKFNAIYDRKENDFPFRIKYYDENKKDKLINNNGIAWHIELAPEKEIQKNIKEKEIQQDELSVNKAHLTRCLFEIFTQLGAEYDKTTITKFVYYLLYDKEAESKNDYQTLLNTVSAGNKQLKNETAKAETAAIKKYLQKINLLKEGK